MSEVVEQAPKVYAKRLRDVVTDVKVVADLDNAVNHYWVSKAQTQEERLARLTSELRDAVKNFHDFIRDHRSMDWVRLDVEEIRRDQCSACHKEWETARDEDGVEYCANCGTDVEP